jgi:hypothetical protein
VAFNEDKLNLPETLTVGQKNKKVKVPLIITNHGNIAIDKGATAELVITATPIMIGVEEPVLATKTVKIGKLKADKTKKVSVSIMIPGDLVLPAIYAISADITVTGMTLGDSDLDNNEAITDGFILVAPAQ